MCENANMRRVTAFLLMSCALLLHHRPASGQSSSAFEHARVSFTSVQYYMRPTRFPDRLEAPPNLVVASMYRPLIETMLRDSPTFRRQCIRIAAEPMLTVHLAIRSGPLRSDIRATTRMIRNAKGRLTAVVDIGFLENTEELIAHELEHVIEQLDEVDLAARAALPHTGVTAIGYASNMFETTRAQRVGLKVLTELGR